MWTVFVKLTKRSHARGVMRIIAKREWKGFFEDGFTQHAQNQILTLFVWISALALFISSRKYWHGGYYNNGRLWLPLLHLVPWYVALTERRRLLGLTAKKQYGADVAFLFQQAFFRLLWVGYIVLIVVEYSLY
jgi:hypothetical protein